MPDQSLASILWRGKYLIALSVAMGIGLGIVATHFSKKVYESTTLIQVQSVSAPGRSTDPFAQQQASQGLATTYAEVLDSRGFLARIRPKVADGALSVSDLASKTRTQAVTTGNDLTTNLIELKVQASSPSAARVLASQIAHAFVKTIQSDAAARSAGQQVQIKAQITILSRQIRGLRRNASNSAVAEQIASLRSARSALTTQLAALVASGIEEGGSVGIAAPPTAPSRPIRPRPVLNILAGVLLGLLAGAGLAWLRTFLDRGLHSSLEVEEMLKLPVLAAVPVRKKFSVDDPVLAEAFDVLRANLVFASLEQPVSVVTLTSFNPKEGKTSTAEGLAYAAARAGMSVLLVDGDVRTRTLSHRFEQRESPGLTNLVAGRAMLNGAFSEIEPGFSLLAAGPTPANPPGVLSSTGMQDLVANMRERFDLVIVDSPPVAHLADASILASFSDAVIVVARVGITARSDLPALATTLRQGPTPIIGVVVLEPRAVEQTYYYPTRRTDLGSQLGTRS